MRIMLTNSIGTTTFDADTLKILSEAEHTGTQVAVLSLPADRPRHLEGVGAGAIHCAACGAEMSPFRMSNGYTIVFDHEHRVAATVERAVAEKLAKKAGKVMALPKESCQNPVLALAPADIPGVVTRMRPFLGNIGTTPAIDMPDSHNAGEFGQFLIGAPYEYGITKEQLECRTVRHQVCSDTACATNDDSVHHSFPAIVCHSTARTHTRISPGARLSQA